MHIWRNTAKKAFKNTKDEDFVVKSGLYDNLIIGSSFKKDLGNYKFSVSANQNEDFHPILTTNGICYTFNNQKLSNIWKPSNVTTSFIDMFPAKHTEKYFGGSGRVQGI